MNSTTQNLMIINYTDLMITCNNESHYNTDDHHLFGLAAYYAWARTKHFGCHSVCLSFCHHGEVTLRSSNVNIACSTATSLSPLIGKVTFYCTFVSREPHKV